MSSVYVYNVKRRGRLDQIGAARNTAAFYISIWQALLIKHGILPTGSGPSLDLATLGKLWCRVAGLPRPDALLVACTFDRAWFPTAIVPELLDALRGAESFSRTAPLVASIVESGPVDRGVCFGSSLNDTWWCDGDTDEGHSLVISESGHRCTKCKKTTQNVQHMLARKPCCRETEDAREYESLAR